MQTEIDNDGGASKMLKTLRGSCAGCCFLFGGTRFKEQSFSMMVNKACCSLLFMAWHAPRFPPVPGQVFSS